MVWLQDWPSAAGVTLNECATKGRTDEDISPQVPGRLVQVTWLHTRIGVIGQVPKVAFAGSDGRYLILAEAGPSELGIPRADS